MLSVPRAKMIPPQARRNVTRDDADGDAAVLLEAYAETLAVPLGLNTRGLGNRVVIFLSKESNWVMMTPKLARQLAAELYSHANKIEGKS